MAFIRKGQAQVEQLDASQIGKLEDSGYRVTAISTDLSVLNQTVATTKPLLPGANVKGYSDSSGKFYVAGTDNVVYDVLYQGPTVKNDVLPQTPTSQPPQSLPPTVNIPPNIPTPPTFVPPSERFIASSIRRMPTLERNPLIAALEDSCVSEVAAITAILVSFVGLSCLLPKSKPD
jgi:hypothetical protein